MFTLSDEAKSAIVSFFSANPDIESVLRVYVTPGSCNGPMLSLMSDQVDPTDVAEEIEGITFCMDRNLAAQTGTVSITLEGGELVARPRQPFIDPSAFSCSCGCACGSTGGSSCVSSGNCQSSCCGDGCEPSGDRG